MVEGEVGEEGNEGVVAQGDGGIGTQNGNQDGSGAVGQPTQAPGNTGGETFSSPAASPARNPLLDRGTASPGTLGDMLQFASVGLQRGSEGVGTQGSPFQPAVPLPVMPAGRGRPGYPADRPQVSAADTRAGDFGGSRRFGGIDSGPFGIGGGNEGDEERGRPKRRVGATGDPSPPPPPQGFGGAGDCLEVRLRRKKGDFPGSLWKP